MTQSTDTNESFSPVPATVSPRSRSALRVHLRFLRLFLRWVSRREGIKWPYKRRTVQVTRHVRLSRILIYVFIYVFGLSIPGLQVGAGVLGILGEKYASSLCSIMWHIHGACFLTLSLLFFWRPFVLQFGRRFNFLALVWSLIFVCFVGGTALTGLAEWHRMQWLALEAAEIKKIMHEQLYRLPGYNLYQPGQPTACSPTANTPNSTECTCERTGSSIQ